MTAVAADVASEGGRPPTAPLHPAWFLQTYSYPELAQMLGIQVSTLRKWICQARKAGGLNPEIRYVGTWSPRARIPAATALAVVTRCSTVTHSGLKIRTAPEGPKSPQNAPRTRPSAPPGPQGSVSGQKSASGRRSASAGESNP